MLPAPLPSFFPRIQFQFQFWFLISISISSLFRLGCSEPFISSKFLLLFDFLALHFLDFFFHGCGLLQVGRFVAVSFDLFRRGKLVSISVLYSFLAFQSGNKGRTADSLALANDSCQCGFPSCCLRNCSFFSCSIVSSILSRSDRSQKLVQLH